MCILSISQGHEHLVVVASASAKAVERHMNAGFDPLTVHESVWLVGDWRSSGEHMYYLSNLPTDTSRRALAGTIKARCVCEHAHQQLKEELGLDHFERRSWTKLHRHALMTCIGSCLTSASAPHRPSSDGAGEK